jgi:hypothetical protein
MKAKPPGYKAFDALTKLLTKVPKSELDAQVARYEAKKAKRSAKKRKKA